MRMRMQRGTASVDMFVNQVGSQKQIEVIQHPAGPPNGRPSMLLI